MNPLDVLPEQSILLKPLPKGFNKKKLAQNLSYPVTNNESLLEIQNLGKNQCLSKNDWPSISHINAWMISAETASFMKWGGLGMIASELPEVFNKHYAEKGDELLVVTPMYLGDTRKKRASLENGEYFGAEGNSIKVKKVLTIKVSFQGDQEVMEPFPVDVYKGRFGLVDYLLLANDRFFSINPHKDNPSAQDGCYIMNAHGINEVERFAFFSKAVYVLLEDLLLSSDQKIKIPNVLMANDWHSGALAGLTKYFTTAKTAAGLMEKSVADGLKSIPIIHLAHHLGYQGWDYENTEKILNSLYEDVATMVFKNAKAVKNTNARSINTLMVHDCYNQASCNFHLADRVVTVSKNYSEEISKELGFGFDFRDILKIRKDHRNFFGIVNGYEKNLISPNKEKIEEVDKYFSDFEFKAFNEKQLNVKGFNKKELIRLISKIATSSDYKKKVIPLIDTYKFEDISDLALRADKIPIIAATSRFAEQKGYDIIAQAMINNASKHKAARREDPIFIFGGAGDELYFNMLKKLKDKATKINKEMGRRIFIFRGYKDEFAYAIQLASDFYLMPSRFEPCGLTQMEAMAKGSLPIAMSTGGLVDTIIDGVDGFRTKVFFSQDNHRIYGNNMTAKRLKNNVNA